MIKVEAQSSPAMTSHTPKWNGSAQLQWSGRVGSARYRCTPPPQQGRGGVLRARNGRTRVESVWPIISAEGLGSGPTSVKANGWCGIRKFMTAARSGVAITLLKMQSYGALMLLNRYVSTGVVSFGVFVSFATCDISPLTPVPQRDLGWQEPGGWPAPERAHSLAP